MWLLVYNNLLYCAFTIISGFNFIALIILLCLLLIDPHQKDDINKKAFDKFKKEHGVVPQMDSAAPSERFEGKGEKGTLLAALSPLHILVRK